MAKLNFNAANKKPMEERTLIPEGGHVFQIIESEIIPNKKKTAERLNIRAKVLNGDYKGSIVFIGLNWGHPNQTAQDISDREFKSICDAVGKGNDQIADTDEIHGIPFIGVVEHSAPTEPYTENGETKYKYKGKAEIKQYLHIESDEAKEIIASFEDKGEVESKPAESAPPWDKN